MSRAAPRAAAWSGCACRRDASRGPSLQERTSVVPPHLVMGLSFGAQFSTVQTPPVVPAPFVTCIPVFVRPCRYSEGDKST